MVSDYKILQKSGKDMLKEIMELKKHENLFPVELEYAQKYIDNWKTLEVEGIFPDLSVHSDEVASHLAEAPSNDGKMFEHYLFDVQKIASGKWSSPSRNKKYIFGREPGNQYGGELYYGNCLADL